jgi:hypothetical protein
VAKKKKRSEKKKAEKIAKQAEDKRQARLKCISYFLYQIPCEELPRESIRLGKRNMKGNYDDQASLKGKRFVPERF